MEIKIETDLNGNTFIIKYDNKDEIVIMTGSVDECKKELIEIIKKRHRVTHYTFDGSDNVISHENDRIMKSKEFCGL